MSPAEINDYNEKQLLKLLLSEKLRELGYSNEQILTFYEMFKVTDHVCPSCWDSERGCQCWNDE